MDRIHWSLPERRVPSLLPQWQKMRRLPKRREALRFPKRRDALRFPALHWDFLVNFFRLAYAHDFADFLMRSAWFLALFFR